MLDRAIPEQRHKPEEWAAGASVPGFDHLDLPRGNASPCGEAGLGVAASLADRLECCGRHAALGPSGLLQNGSDAGISISPSSPSIASIAATSQSGLMRDPVRDALVPTILAARISSLARANASFINYSQKRKRGRSPAALGEKEILFLEAMPEPARGRITARQVSERSPFGVAVGIEAEAAIRSAPLGSTSVFDEDAASECGELNDHRNLLMGLGGIARLYVSLVSRFDAPL